MGSAPLKDASIEEAQDEIHRRLPRGRKLKRIEQEEMRLIAATGWRRPIESVAAGGSSVRDAADAIEDA